LRGPARSKAREEIFPGLFVRELEPRRVLSAGNVVVEEVGRTLVIGAGLQAHNSPETFELSRQGDSLQVSVNGQMTAAAQLEQITSIKLQAASDQDTFIFNFSGGNIAPSGGIEVSGVQGPHGSLDKLVLEDGSATGPIASVTQQFTGMGNGSIQVGLGGATGGTASIAYSGIGAIVAPMQTQQVIIEDSTPSDTLMVSGNSADGEITIAASQGTAVSLAAPFGGLTIQSAANGTVDFTGATDLQGSSLTVSAGSIQVDGTLTSHGGSIDLDAGASGTVLISGSIDVSSTVSGRMGGSVELLGNRVALVGSTQLGAQVNASGDAGGGTVLIGGDYHGANPGILDASYAYVGPGVQISADAITQGDGGHVVVWSNVATQFYGNISAQGGEQSGNGGAVEVSGGYLDFRGTVATLAPHGNAGSLLLDPTNLTIDNGTNTNVSGNGYSTPFVPSGSPSILTWGSISAALAQGNVTVTTLGSPATTGDLGNINITDGTTTALNSSDKLTLDAAGSITIAANSPITNIGSGDMEFDAANGVTISSTVSVLGTLTINSNGPVTQTSKFTAGGMIKSGSGTMTLSLNNSITNSATIEAGSVVLGAGAPFGLGTGLLTMSGGTLDLNGNTLILDSLSGTGGTITDNSSLSGTSTLFLDPTVDTTYSGTIADGPAKHLAIVLSGSGGLTLSGDNTYSGVTDVARGTLQLGNSMALGAAGGVVKVAAGAVLDLDGQTVGNKATTISGTGIANGGVLINSSATAASLGGTLTLAGDSSIGGSGGLTLSSVIGGDFNLTKIGSGALTLTDFNTFGGAGKSFTLGAGTVNINSSAALGDSQNTFVINGGAIDNTSGGAVTTNNYAQQWNADFTFSGTNPLNLGTGTVSLSSSRQVTVTTPGSPGLTVGGVISGNFGLTKLGGGTLTLSGANTYSGLTTVSNGALSITSTGSLNSGDALTVGSTGTALFANSGQTLGAVSNADTTANGLHFAAVTDTTTLASLTGAGNTNVAGNATITGSFDSGTLTVGGTASIGTMTGGTANFNGATAAITTLNGGTVNLGATVLTVSNGTDAGTITGANGSLTKTTAGTLTLSGANTFGGLTTVSGGTLSITSTGSLTSGDALTIGSAGTALFANSGQTLGAVSNANTTANGLHFAAVTDTTTLASLTGAGNTALVGNATITGSFDSGTLTVGGTVTIGTMTSGTANFNGATAAITTLNGGMVNLGATALTVSNGTDAGTITGASGSLTKISAGTLTLSGANTFGGLTTVSGGTLSITSTGSLNSGDALTVGSAGTALFANAGQTLGAVSNADTAADSLDFTATTGTTTLASLTGAGNTNIVGNAAITGSFDSGTLTVGGTITIGTMTSGTANLNGATAAITTLNGGTANLGTTALTVSNGTDAGTITGASGSLTKTTAGTLTLSGANTYGGLTDVNGGTLSITSTGSLTSGDALTVGSAGTALFANSGQTLGAVSNADTAANSLDFTAATGTTTLASLTGAGNTNAVGNATITGSFDSGTLTVGGTATIGTMTSGTANVNGATAAITTLNGGTVNLGATVLTVSNGTDSGAITGASGSLTKTTAATLTLSGANTYGGLTSVNGGTLSITSTGSLNSGDALTVGSAGTALIANAGQTLGAVSNSDSAADSLDFTAATGTTTLASLTGAGNTNVVGNAAFTGSFDSGTLTVGGTATIGTMTSGTANLNGATASITTLNGGTVNLGATVLTVSNGTDAGAITGANGSLTKITAGTLTLSGANTYGGLTSVNGGTLSITSTGSLNSGDALTVGSTATALFANSGQTLGSVSNADTAADSLDFTAATGTTTLASLTGAGNTNVVGNATITTSFDTGTLTVGGAATIGTMTSGTANLNGATASITTLNGGTVNLGATVLTVSNGTDASAITGASGSLTKTTAGTLTLSGANSFGGLTTVSGGILSVTSTGSLSSGDALTVGSAGTALFANAGQALGAVSNSDTAADSLDFTAATGTTTLASLTGAGNTSFVGNATITGSFDSGTLAVGGAATIGTMASGTANLNGATAAITTLNGGMVNLGATVLTVINGTDAGTITGANGSLTKITAGTLTLSGANTFGGLTTVSGGTLSITATGSLNSGDALTVGSTATALFANAGQTLGAVSNADTSAGSLDFTAATGTTMLASLTGAGNTNFVGNAAITGSFDSGTLTVGGTATVGKMTSGTANLNGATASITTLNGGTVNLGATVLTVSNGTDAGAITGASGSLTKIAAGTLSLSGANTYGGGTALNGGTLVLGGTSAIGTMGNISFGGGTLEFTANNTNDYSPRIKNSTAAITLNTNGQNVTMSSAIDASNTGGLTKLGGGTLLLSGNNSYTGLTTIEMGTVQLGNPNALGSAVDGTVVDPGAVLDLDGQNVGAEAITINGTGLAGNGALINSSSAAASVSGAVVLASDSSISNSGDLALTGGISGGFALTLLGAGNLNTSASRLFSAVSTIADNKSGGSVFIDQGPGGVDLSGTMTHGSNLDLADSGTTTLVGPLNAGTGNVVLGGAVLDGTNLLTANSLTLEAGGGVGLSGVPLDTNVNSLLLSKTSGDSFLSQNSSTSLILSGVAGGNLTLTAGNTTIAAGGLTVTGGLLAVDSLAINAPISMGAGSLVASGVVDFNATGSLLVPTVQAGGGQTYGGAATLAANTVLTSDHNVTFDQTIDRNSAFAWSLTINAGQGTMTANTIYASQVVNAGGNIALDGIVGGGVFGPIGALSLSGHGSGSSAIDLDHNVTTQFGQAFAASTLLKASVTLLDTGGGTIALSGSLNSDDMLDVNGNSPWSLTLQTDGPTEITGQVGETSPLSGLLVEGYSAASLGTTVLGGGNIITSGTTAAGHIVGQTYENAVVLAAASALSDNSGNDITFNSRVDSQAGQNWGLAASTAGNEVFNAAVGGSVALASLTTDASGTVGGEVLFNFAGTTAAPTVKTTGSQTYYDAVRLQQETVLSAGGDIFAAATVDSVSGPQGLTLTAAGNITFNGSIGGSHMLQDLVVTQANQVVFGGASVKGLDPRSSGPVAAIDTGGIIDIGQAAAVGGIVFNGGPGASYNLSVVNGGRNITLNGPVMLESSASFGQPAAEFGTVDFTSTVVSQGTEYNNLAVYAGTVNFHGNVGRFVPDTVGNPDPNLALGTATIEVSGAINIDPGVEIRVWHANLGIPGGVSQITPVLTLGPISPPPASPSNPTQTVTGFFGLAPNYTEYGENFTIVVQWPDSVTTTYAFDPAEFAKSNLNAGGTLNLFVNADGSFNWAASSLNPGTGSGVVNFSITRTYPLAYLATVTHGLQARATIVTDNSLNFTIDGVRLTGTSADSPVTPVAGAHVGQQFTAQAPPPIEFQAFTAPVAQVVSSTQLPSANTLSGGQPVREEVKKVVRHFEIVKVDVEGHEGEPNPLPDDTLEQLPTLLRRFIKSLPNGRYRIYLIEGAEGGAQTSRLLREFYKSGKSLGDPVHEIGPGSIEGEVPNAPPGNPAPGNPAPGNSAPETKAAPAPAATPAPGTNGHNQGTTSQQITSQHRSSQHIVPAVSSRGARVRAAQSAIPVVAALGAFTVPVDKLLESSAGTSFRRAARVFRRLQRGEKTP
jgi:fibronectin-binding autotransporter adhesin